MGFITRLDFPTLHSLPFCFHIGFRKRIQNKIHKPSFFESWIREYFIRIKQITQSFFMLLILFVGLCSFRMYPFTFIRLTHKIATLFAIKCPEFTKKCPSLYSNMSKWWSFQPITRKKIVDIEIYIVTSDHWRKLNTLYCSWVLFPPSHRADCFFIKSFCILTSSSVLLIIILFSQSAMLSS